jgi:hypothetical protein
MLIRVGDKIINLDNVLQIELNWVDEEEPDEGPQVVFEFVMRGADHLDDGENITNPYLAIFSGEEAEALRRYLTSKVPDLLESEPE